MIKKSFVRKEQYYDSVFLMRLAARLGTMPGIIQISSGMGTPLNKATMRDLGVLDENGEGAGVNDLVVGIAADTMEQAQAAFDEFSRLIREQPEKPADLPHTIEQAVRENPGIDLALIGTAGDYAADEGMKALKKGLNVYMFSDNVPLEQEIALKKYAKEHGLLMMGPDCGLCMLDGIAIGLCSKTRRGTIGIAAASGSGMQEVMCIIHRNGFGISQAIGTGGRDLSDEVGGITMLQGIDILESDPDTKVIVLISKPPSECTLKAVLERVQRCSKPTVVQFIHADPEMIRTYGAYPTGTFLETAEAAMAFAGGSTPKPHSVTAPADDAFRFARALSGEQKYLRGIYCGGSLAEETLTLALDRLNPLYSNVAFGEVKALPDARISRGHCLIDIGAEEFTRGRPHAAIDPSIRIARFEQEARDPETAVILMDVLLGYSLYEDPGGMLAPVISREREKAAKDGRSLSVVIALCGTDLDPQGYEKQKECLEKAGAAVLYSNEEASMLALEILRIKKEADR